MKHGMIRFPYPRNVIRWTGGIESTADTLDAYHRRNSECCIVRTYQSCHRTGDGGAASMEKRKRGGFTSKMNSPS